MCSKILKLNLKSQQRSYRVFFFSKHYRRFLCSVLKEPKVTLVTLKKCSGVTVKPLRYDIEAA